MKKSVLILLLCLTADPAFASKEFLDTKLESKTVNVVKVVLDGNTRIVTPFASDGGDTLENLLSKAGSDTGINGAYFCPADYAWCGKTYTNADRAYEGSQDFKYAGDFGAKGFFGFGADDRPIFALDNVWYGKGIDRKVNADRKKELKNGISNIPVLLLNGEDVLSESESELDAKMKASSTKSFICSDVKNDTVYFGTVGPLTIYELPGFLKRNFACQNTIGLDNGGSLGLTYEGRSIRKPGRKIMDAFAVVDVVEASKPADSTKASVPPKVGPSTGESSKSDVAADRRASAIVSAIAKKLRSLKKSGLSEAKAADLVATLRTKVAAISKAQEAKDPKSSESKTWKRVLQSPLLNSK